MGASANRGDGNIDFRLLVCVSAAIENLHIISIPIRKSHTGSVMFEMVGDVLAAAIGVL